MGNKAPISIITDQDPAMKVAIKEVWPKTVHRCCQWHVMRKAREQLLVHFGKNEGFQKKFKVVINRSLKVADFERSWKKMLQTYKLEDNRHLKIMFDKRDEWVPAYFRGVFFANMSTAQRSEGMNTVMIIGRQSHLYL
jgi:MULE transposase domain